MVKEKQKKMDPSSQEMDTQELEFDQNGQLVHQGIYENSEFYSERNSDSEEEGRLVIDEGDGDAQDGNGQGQMEPQGWHNALETMETQMSDDEKTEAPAAAENNTPMLPEFGFLVEGSSEIVTQDSRSDPDFPVSTEEDEMDYGLQYVFPENYEEPERYSPLSSPSPTPSIKTPVISPISIPGSSPTEGQEIPTTMTQETEEFRIPEDARITFYDEHGVPSEQFYNSETQSFEPVKYLQSMEPRTPPGLTLEELQNKTTVKISKPTYNTRARTRQNMDKTYSMHDALPFECGICHERFAKKLVLNNHTEKRHGIKYVFTERGKKVKLVRMPEEHLEGEKLDPCVEMLIKNNKQIAKSVLGVADLRAESSDANVDFGVPNPTAHELDPSDVIKHKVTGPYGAGILVPTLKFCSVKAALERGQTPFVVYQTSEEPWKSFLLAVETFSKEEQLLVPATLEDMEKATDVTTETIEEVVASEASEAPGPSTRLAPLPIKSIKKDFRNIAIVALAKHVVDPLTGLAKLDVSPPPQALANPELIKLEYFTKTLVPLKLKHLRCLAVPPKPTLLAAMEVKGACNVESTPAPKRTYTRRSQGRRNKALDQEVKQLRRDFRMRTARFKLDTIGNKENESPMKVENDGSTLEAPRKRKRTPYSDWDTTEDEESDEEYDPRSQYDGPKSNKVLRLPRRGRPRKLNFN